MPHRPRRRRAAPSGVAAPSALRSSLPTQDIAYTWMPALGGMRRPVQGSVHNAAWKEEGFRGYADHMQTEEFEQARRQLEELAWASRCAALCAEAQPVQCHRQLLADAFVALGWEVQHMIAANEEKRHRLTSTAVVDARGGVTYPGNPELPF